MKLYLKSGELLSSDYNRVVIGERGAYVEFTEQQLVASLKYKYNILTDKDIYYYWMEPMSGTGEKIYYQLKTVKYADYKVGMYYVDPGLLKDFNYEGEQLILNYE